MGFGVYTIEDTVDLLLKVTYRTTKETETPTFVVRQIAGDFLFSEISQ